ncbi:hypothetical protein [Pseudomonas sp. BF-R-19]|uniref:hypothetical protein n=1 Tax=Pseudomonas sp. BF-R-19 TaxID=2832397 RepID=UPI002958CC62|nr:hypothetical protein [Pseudomonas sp. BF-R-19]
MAVCVLRNGAQLDETAILDWMASRVERYKFPKRVFFWDALPKSGYEGAEGIGEGGVRRRGLLTSTGGLDARH